MNIIFAGTPEFALPSLQALLKSRHRVVAVYTQPDRPKGRGQRLLMSPIKQLALEKKLPICQPITFRDVNAQEKLAAWKAELMVVVAYGIILPPAILSIPPLGCINVHASLLPRWRGAAPIQRAILAGDKETGISIMQMDAGLDTGQILQKVSCNIKHTDNSQSLENFLAHLGAQVLQTSLDQIEQGTCELKPQDNHTSTYAKKIDKTEAKIDWSQSADVIERMIRAFNPKPVAYTFNDALLMRIWSAKILDKTTNNHPPGTILNVGEQGIDVMTGKGSLRILQLQLPGGRCLFASEVLHSKTHLFKVGKLLG